MDSLSFSASDDFSQQPGSLKPAASVVVRLAEAQDVKELARLLTLSFYSSEGMMQWLLPLIGMGIAEDIRSRLRSPGPHYACFVAVQSATLSPQTAPEIVGTIEMTVRPDSPWQFRQGQHVYLSNVAVREDQRRRGIAQQMLAACEQKALEWGFRDLYLHVLENNQRARRLYFRAGYRLRRVEFSITALLLGRPQRYLLHKRLPN